MLRYFFTVILIVLGTFLLSNFSFNQGFDSKGGLRIYSNQTHDALWHIALQESLKKSIPPENPLYSGEKITGYHYLTDIFLNILSSILGISTAVFYLNYSLILIAFLFCLSTYLLLNLIFKSTKLVYLGYILAVFGSGFAYLAPVFFINSSSNQSVFWLDQPINLLSNQQLTLSLAVVNFILFFYLKSFNKYWYLIGILLGLLTGIKIYAAAILFPSFSLVFLFQIFTCSDWKTYLKTLLLGSIIALILILFVGSNSKFPFIFQPGWFIESMYQSKDRLNDPSWELRRLIFLQHNNYPRLLLVWAEGILLFLMGNFGLKILGLFLVFKKKLDTFLLLIICITVLSILIPLFFLQEGVVWNSIQFMHYAQIPLVILTLVSLETLLKKKAWIILFLIILSALPTTYQTFLKTFNLDNYAYYQADMVQKIQQLNKINPQTQILVSDPLNQDSLIPALSGHPVYFADPTINEILLINFDQREKYSQDVENQKERCQTNQVFINSNLDPIYCN